MKVFVEGAGAGAGVGAGAGAKQVHAGATKQVQRWYKGGADVVQRCRNCRNCRVQGAGCRVQGAGCRVQMSYRKLQRC